MSLYLDRYGYAPPLISEPPDPNLEISVVIPCYLEPDIISTLQSLAECEPIAGSVEIIVVVNQSSSDPTDIQEYNKQTIKQLNQWASSRSGGSDYHFLHQELPPKDAGVGLSRKIGMDEATRRFNDLKKDGVIVCLDADCTCAPNYFRAILQHFKSHPHTPGCSIYYQHPLDGPLPVNQYHNIACYELHLRYYTHALRYSGLPCAFQTVGSAMAVKVSAYEKQGGMNKRKAGEDFYFLQKIIKLGGFTELRSTTVYPSARLSDRVPFGTGKAMIQHSGSAEYQTYHPNTFRDLRYLAANVTALYGADQKDIVEVWKSYSDAMRGFIEQNTFVERILDLKKRTSSLASFTKRFFQWCDGFTAFKFANYAREHHYPAVKVAEAAGWLLREAYGGASAGDNVRKLLMIYRALDREQKKFKNAN